MKVAGEVTLRAPVDAVWTALHDPDLLARTIPGCDRFEVTGAGAGQFSVTTAMTAVSGTYSGRLSIAEREEPGYVALTASGSGEQGEITADLTLRLAEASGGATLVSYEASGVVAGAVAGVGTRLLASAAKRLAAEFFAAVDEALAEAAARPATAAPVTAPAPASGPAPARGGADVRVVVLAGAAAGLAGIVAGVLLGRKSRLFGRKPG